MSDDDSTRSTGRGGLAVAGAKIYFILLGLVQQILLQRVLGLAGYGALSRVLSMSSIVYNTITTTSIQAVSRTVVQAEPETAPATVRRALLWHAGFGLLLAAVLAALVPWIAKLAGAAHVETPLRLLAVIVFVYSVYTPLIGVVNGQKRFTVQAGFDVTAATLRTLGLVVGAFVARRLSQSGPTGAAGGFVITSSLIMLAAVVVIGVGRRGPTPLKLGAYAAVAFPLLLGQLLLNLLFQADLILLGRFASHAAMATGVPLSRADDLVGAYRATQLFSFLPYQILIAITFILFPMLAQAARERDPQAIASYVRTGLRLALLIAGAMVTVTLGLAPRLLDLLFGAEAATLGARALSLLSFGFGAFAILGILTTVLNSLGRELQSFLVTLFAFTLVVIVLHAGQQRAPLRRAIVADGAGHHHGPTRGDSPGRGPGLSRRGSARLASDSAAHAGVARRRGVVGALRLPSGQAADVGRGGRYARCLLGAARAHARAHLGRSGNRAQSRAALAAGSRGLAGRNRLAHEQVLERLVAR